jgi:hypothetical protein
MMTIHSLPPSAIETLTDEELKRLFAQRKCQAALGRSGDPGEEESTA